MQENIAKHFSHGRNGYMDEKEVLNFVMHFERITENMKTYMPQKSNFVLKKEAVKTIFLSLNPISSSQV